LEIFDAETEGSPNIAGLRRSLPRVEGWLRRVRDEPFFLLLHTYDPHLPYAPPPPHDSMFLPEYTGDLTGDQTRDLLRRVRELGRYEHSPEHFVVSERGL
jgi:hypothetical protein